MNNFYKENKIRKLKSKIQAIEGGVFVHVTCFRSISRFFETNEEKLSYARFLVFSSFELFKNNQSLSVEQIIPHQTKCSFYETLLQCLDFLITQKMPCNQESLNNLQNDIEVFYPEGFRRVNIRATRRKIFDVDIALLNVCILMLQEKTPLTYWLIQMTKYFCISYENLRYQLNRNSISRFEKIIAYFEN